MARSSVRFLVEEFQLAFDRLLMMDNFSVILSILYFIFVCQNVNTMKKTVLILSALAFSTFSQANISICETFDSCAIDGNNQGHAFNLLGNGNGGCLNNWEVVNGAPSIFNNSTISGITAYNGSNYALLNTRHDFTDGVALIYNFQQGKSYRVTFQAQTRNYPDSLSIDFILLQNQIPYTYNSNVGASTIASVPSSGTYTAHSISGFSSLGAWSPITFDINNVPANYSRIWFRQNTATSDDVNFLFDNVCIEDITQQGQCNDFDSCVIDVNNQGHAFNLLGNGNGGCLNNWEVVNGAPSVFNNSTLSGITAYNGSNYALLNTRHDFTDGVALLYNFIAGKNYRITFQAQTRNTPDNLDFDFILLQNQIPYVYNSNVGASTIAAIPSSGIYTAHSLSGFSSLGAWSPVTFDINNVPANYSRLWIRQNTVTSNDVNFLFDDFCVEELNSTGITNTLLAEFDVYPNPANDIINIKSENIIDSYTLYDIHGRVIMTNHQLHSKDASIYIHSIASGVYVMSVKTSLGVATKRMVIE